MPPCDRSGDESLCLERTPSVQVVTGQAATLSPGNHRRFHEPEILVDASRNLGEQIGGILVAGLRCGVDACTHGFAEGCKGARQGFEDLISAINVELFGQGK